MAAALDAGADYVGLVFYFRSPRNVAPETARRLAAMARGRAQIVALVVRADDGMLTAIIEAANPDLFQLHGKERPPRVAAIKARFGRPIMKAIGVATSADAAAAYDFRGLADMILFDAKPPAGVAGALPGGNGLAFDWSVLDGFRHELPWMLSGGLTPETVADAIRRTGAPAVDVSSGVESAPGVKDAELIRQFIVAAKGA